MREEEQACLTILKKSVRECAEANFPHGACRICLVTLEAALKAEIDINQHELELMQDEQWLTGHYCACRDDEINLNCTGCF
jgi:hypothetical protein